MKKTLILCGALATFILSGCSTTQLSCSVPGGKCSEPVAKKPTLSEQGDDNLNIPAFPYKPMIGTRNNDAKTVVDQGVVMKIYVATYKDNKKALVAAHDKYVWAKEPGFVVGVDRPEMRKRTGIMTPAQKVPFVFGAGEVDASSIENNTKIKDYVNVVAEAEKRDTEAVANMTEADSRFDGVIKNYVEKSKGY